MTKYPNVELKCKINTVCQYQHDSIAAQLASRHRSHHGSTHIRTICWRRRPTRTRKPDFVVPAVLVGAVLAYKPNIRREAIQWGYRYVSDHHAYIQCLLKCILSLVLYHDELPFLCFALLFLGKNNYLHQICCLFFNSETI